MKLDMHCHTAEGSSDSKVHVAEYISILKSRGFDGMVITDHDSYNGYRYWLKHRSEMPEDFVVLKGIEYDTLDAGHFLVIMPRGVNLRVLEQKGLPVRELIRIVHACGGVLGPAHSCGEPFLSIFSTGFFKFNQSIAEQFDFLEGFNSCEDAPANEKACEIARRYELPTSGGSDSHKPDCVGTAYTLISKNIKNETELVEYIKAGLPMECGGERYYGTLKDHLGIWNKLLVYGFYPYNKFGALMHIHRRHLELARLHARLVKEGKERHEPAVYFISDMLLHEKIQKMSEFTQHGRVSTLEHCRNVVKTCDKLTQILKVPAVDRRVMIRSALLHDFYLYDWHHEDDGSHRWHGFNHAERARKNAVKYFKITDHEQAIIASHMWPLNITKIPKSREAWLVCAADKIEACRETFFKRK